MNKLLIICTLFLSLVSVSFANPNINARTIILMDYDSDEILYELDADAQIYPASMTKIMTSMNIHFEITSRHFQKQQTYHLMKVYFFLTNQMQ